MRVCFVKSSRQNIFFDELLDALRASLVEAGVDTETTTDFFPALAEDLVYILVPHEYIPMTMPTAHPTDAQLRRTVAITTEQPDTPWFEKSVSVAARAGATLDIHPLGLAELRRRGVRAERLFLGYVPSWDRWQEADEPRSIDAIFFGGHTDRRARALGSCGRVLQTRRASLHLMETWKLHTAADGAFLSGSRKLKRLADSKILLNVHRVESGYFEWLRLIEAITNGCLVLTEHSTGYEPLVPGEHFVSASIANLPHVLNTLLEDEDSVRVIRDEAYAFLRAELPLAKSISTLANAAEVLARRPLSAHPAMRSPRPAPKPIPIREPEWKTVFGQRNGIDAVRAALKRMIIEQRRLERRLAQLADDRDDSVAVRTSGPYHQQDPEVSVVVTLYNYAEVVEEALRSVALSSFEPLEVVLVDDASTDGSLNAAEAALRDLSWLPAKVVARPHNKGLPSARNLGIEHARAPHIFILDADNAVYPHSIERLQHTLAADPDAAFAYGILERFDDSGAIDLLSWLPWDQSRFRHGNYIDAMALIRRSALDRVGGFITDDRLFGWEDFALWCAFAQQGLYGVHVPEILARYRAHPSSMIALTNIDTSDAWSLLLERFPFLTASDGSASEVR